ncbi:hypothetical protein GCM10022236_07630 [Microlunatus ginsengisoli]|uniref:Uncharacterized protein n=1 Tax=Microlunatus ginsengisoli TaxID=363863 RepID=A0ABP6ZFU5_9ACTN
MGVNLLSSLVPLETLDGWPPAPPVSVVGLLLLLVGFPLLVFLIIFGISALRPAPSAYDAMQEREALWAASNAPEAVTEGRRAAIPAAEAASDAGAGKSDDAGKGGASARW